MILASSMLRIARRWAVVAGPVAGLVALFMLVSCGSAPPRPDQGDRAIPVWPSPPDPPRFQYETTLRSAADVLPSKVKGEIVKRRIDAGGIFDPVFDKVGAIAARNGRIYLTDTVRRSIVVFDVPRRRVFRFGQRHPDNLIKPVGIALDGESRVYVADVSKRQVVVFDSLGLPIRAIGAPGDLERPVGVAVDQAGQRIYVIDRASNESDLHRVVIFDAAGGKIGVLGERGAGPGQFNVPIQGVVGRDGTLFVLDSGNFRVQAFAADGTFLRAFGAVGSGASNFARPRGIAVDDNGNVYVTDAYFGNVQIFNPQGELLLAIGSLGEKDVPGRFGLIAGIAVDETGRIYIGDQLFRKVEVIRRLPLTEQTSP